MLWTNGKTGFHLVVVVVVVVVVNQVVAWTQVAQLDTEWLIPSALKQNEKDGNIA